MRGSREWSVGRIATGLAAALALAVGCEQQGGGTTSLQSGADGSGGGGLTDRAPRLAFVTNGVASFWTIAARGAEDGAAAAGAQVSVHMPAEGLTSQKQILEDLVARGVDGVAVSPIDPANQTETLNMVAARAHLVTHDSDAPDSNRVCYIGMDNYIAGRMAG